MVDWSRQFQEAIKNWTEVQEKTRERWAEATRSLSNSDAGSQWQEEAAKVLDAWEESVKATTEFPLEQARVWAERLSRADGAPPQAREWAERLHSTARVLAGVQKQLLETWFASLRNLTPTEREGNSENVFETWREASQKAFEAQADWMRLWVTGAGEGTGRDRGQGKSSSGGKS